MRGEALQVVVILACVKVILSRAVDIIAEPHTADTDHSISRSMHAAGGLVRILLRNAQALIVLSVYSSLEKVRG